MTPPPRQHLTGTHVIGEALRARRRSLHQLWLRAGRPRRELASLAEAARAAGVPVSERPPDELGVLAGSAGHQGAVLEAGPLPEADLGWLLSALDERPVVALDGVEDPQNVGALFRAAEAAGARAVVLTERRSPPLGPALARASAGAAEWLPAVRASNLDRALAALQEAGCWVVGADPAASHHLYELPAGVLRGRLVLALGAEGRGLRPGVRKRVDHPVRLPMEGQVGSLNVAAAGAVILYEMWRIRHAECPSG